MSEYLVHYDGKNKSFNWIKVDDVKQGIWPEEEIFKPNIDIFIIFFVIIAIPFIKQEMDGVNNSICDCIAQLHNRSDVHSIWKKNILMKTSPIPIECLHGILRVTIAGILNQLSYLLKEQLLENANGSKLCFT